MAPHDTVELRRIVFQRTLEAVVVTSREGVIVDYNPAAEETFGWAGIDVHERDWVGLALPPDRRPAFRERLQDVGTLAGHRQRLDLARPDGSSFPAELTVQPCDHVAGSLRILFARDVSERVRVDRLKSEFVSTVSHELRTPLTSISGSLSLLLGGVAGELPDAARQMVQIALNNSQRLVRLINDILDIEKIESGRMDFRREEHALVPILEQALEVNRGYADEHDVRFVLEVRPCAREAQLSADRDRLLQVLTNLLSNAVKYSPPQGEVGLRAVRRGGQVRISVRDHGAGIPASFQARVFQKFAQADSSATRQVGGTGLGLSICKAIVEEHEGSIDFRTGPEGTTFFFELPLLGSDEPSPRCLADRQPLHRVLVVEHDAEAASLIEMVLRAAGYRWDRCHTLAEAEELLAGGEYRALVLDLELPEGSGLEVLNRLGRRVPAVIVSGNCPLPIPEELGVVAQLGKPIDEQQLNAAVALALRSEGCDRARILHVEDDVDIQSVVSLLVGDRAEVVPAGGCCDALWLLETERFDLVILDLDLPDGSGRDLMDRIDAPVIVFSASEAPVAACAGAYVKSRTSCEELLAAIERVLDLPQGAFE